MQIVNMTSVGQILNYKKREDEDYYGILGCDEHSSVSLIFFVDGLVYDAYNKI